MSKPSPYTPKPLINNELRPLRAKARISQIEVARLVCISQHRYWKIENGYQLPNVVEIGLIAQALGVTIAELGFAVPLDKLPLPRERNSLTS